VDEREHQRGDAEQHGNRQCQPAREESQHRDIVRAAKMDQECGIAAR
jgi:hypothetical protein